MRKREKTKMRKIERNCVFVSERAETRWRKRESVLCVIDTHRERMCV